MLAITAAAATATAAFWLRTRFVHIQRATSYLGAVQRGNCPLSLFGIRHLYKSEATRAPGFAVRHYAYAIHLPITFEQLPQLIFSGVEIQIPYKDVFQRDASVVELFECGLTSAGKQVLLSLEKHRHRSWRTFKRGPSIAGNVTRGTA
jgi:hypothetical protein